ncbi:MAG TPA: hydantoinase/oxoprolinase family protein [Acidimicrobiales bacterium]|nr:hydantoinase/oxoprolinase family protein [Acidimicrobiales bacterium]
MQLIGVDAGGTFTDTVVATADGRLGVGKALSTPGHLEDGVLASVTAAAADLGTTLDALLAGTDVVAHGTTAGLNALLTGTGARVGLLTTAGFESTLAIAKANKVLGLTEDDLERPTRWDKPPLLVPRRRTRGVGGRIDAAGAEVAPFDAAGARAAVAELADAGVESVAVSLLWSVANPAHEEALADLVAEALPGVHLSVSNRLVPRIGEYERTATVVVDAYVGPLVADYLHRLEGRLVAAGFGGLFAVMRMGGGVLPGSLARRMPVHTLHSGPVGGVGGAAKAGAAAGEANIITTDVGGTSFDVGLVVDGQVLYSPRPMIERQALAIPVVDVTSIGTGGGSIAWFDPALGVLRVGPDSAGADPGPACYGRGGTRPTVTDAAAVLGYVHRLGRALNLDRDAARRAIRTGVAEPLGLSVEDAADGVVQVACEQMRDLVRRTTVQRGHDPADFVLYAFGGAGPQYAGRYAAGLGVAELVVPALAAEFSAFGAVVGDVKVLVERDLVPRPLDADLDQLNDGLRRLAADGVAQLAGAVRRGGPAPVVTHAVGLRFYRQVHRIDVPVPALPVDRALAAELVDGFVGHYERIVGAGTARAGTPVELVSMSVEVAMPVDLVLPEVLASPASAEAGRRPAWFDGGWVDCPVLRWDRLGPGDAVRGPAFVESEQTTVVVYPGQSARADRYGNLRLVLS